LEEQLYEQVFMSLPKGKNVTNHGQKQWQTVIARKKKPNQVKARAHGKSCHLFYFKKPPTNQTGA